MRVATRRRRRGTASGELALLLPVLAFILVAAVDFARVFRAYTVVTWCARDGAVYGSGSSTKSTDTTGIQTAALADASDLSPQPTVTSTTGTGTDTDGNNS